MKRFGSYLNKACVLVALLFFFVGCNAETEQAAKSGNGNGQTATSKGEDHPSNGENKESGEEDHEHVAGAHGGIIVPIGRDSYHVEVIFEKSGKLSLYTLGADESRVMEVELQDLNAFAKIVGQSDSTSLIVKPDRQPDDSQEKTSRFSVQLPDNLIGQAMDVTIPSIRIGDDRFRLGFSSSVETHESAAMPAKVANKEEQELYLSPGGIYSESDIAANGNVTASQKFAGFVAAHDINPKTGTKICPITLTKSNPKCTWIVGGKTYEFCCPPCVDEFVKLAKSDPGKIQSPEKYVKE